jgi:hypothetical protein
MFKAFMVATKSNIVFLYGYEDRRYISDIAPYIHNYNQFTSTKEMIDEYKEQHFKGHYSLRPYHKARYRNLL